MNQIEILHHPSEEEPFVVLYKPHGMPSAPLKEGDENNALSYAISRYPQIKALQGLKSCEYGLLHRIDTTTDGLLLIATNQGFFDHIQNLQNNEGFIKSYKAECIKSKADETFPPFEKLFVKPGQEINICSYFRAFGPKGREVRPVTKASNPAALKKIGKPVLYSTKIKLVEINENKYIFSCELTKGFRHQVRCHLAWAGYPIINDEVYNNAKSEGAIHFTAYKLKFTDEKGREYSFEI